MHDFSFYALSGEFYAFKFVEYGKNFNL